MLNRNDKAIPKEHEIKSKKSIQDLSYESYARNLRKIPSDELYQSYLEAMSNLKNNDHITAVESEHIEARKLWTDVVSETYQANQIYSQQQNLREKVIQRLKDISQANPEALYEKCINYIREQSVITLTFKADFLEKGLTDFQPLNMWEKDNRNKSGYTQHRDRTERQLFRFVSDKLNKNFFSNIHARPRYGALLLLDRHTAVNYTSNYGRSFIVLKDVAKLNALFCPGDSYNYLLHTRTNYKVCTIHHLEFLLWQCPIGTLKAIAAKVENGVLPNWYNQNSWEDDDGGYLEVMVPAINIFDPNLVEHIHINSNSFNISEDDINFIQQLGINITNTATGTPYRKLGNQFMKVVEDDNVETVNILLDKHPSLAKLSNIKGRHPIHIAAQYGSIQVLQTFYQSKYDFTMYSSDKRSPLHLAAQYGHLDSLKFIINSICRQTSKDILQIIDATEDSWTALHLASHAGNADIVRYLIDNGSNPNAVKLNGWTALHLAAVNQHHEVIEILLHGNANPAIKNNQSQLPEDLFVRKRGVRDIITETKQELLSALINNQTDIITKYANKGWFDLPLNNKKLTALHVAVVTANFQLVCFVLKIGVDIDAINKEDETALVLAARSDDINIFKLLIEHGANIWWKKPGDWGDSLFAVVKNCLNPEFLNFLESVRGADKIKQCIKEIPNHPIAYKLANLFDSYAHPPMFTLSWRNHREDADKIAKKLRDNMDWNFDECKTCIASEIRQMPDLNPGGTFTGLLYEVDKLGRELSKEEEEEEEEVRKINQVRNFDCF